MKINFSDKDFDFDKALARTDYKSIDLTIPNNLSVQTSIDTNGYFLAIQRQDDTSADGKRHYFPMRLDLLCVNGLARNLQLERLSANEAEADTATHRKDYFEDIDRVSASREKTAVMYGLRLAELPALNLAMQEKTLRADAEAYPDNPYFRILLAISVSPRQFSRCAMNSVNEGE